MKIKLNGKVIQTDASSLAALQRDYFKGRAKPVVIYKGYQTEEDLPLSEMDEVVFIERGKLPDQGVMEQMLMARHTPGVHEKVKKARVAVAGLGGLGSNIAINLARTGVGYLHLVDFDVVEPSNLNRQQYGIVHLGMTKAEAMAKQIKEINPFIEVKAEVKRVTTKNATALFSEETIVCEAFDQPKAKAMLVSTLLSECPEKHVVAASGMAGYGFSNTIVTEKVADHLYICGDGETAAAPGCGLMAPRVAICAGHQANAVLRLILGEYEV